MTENMKFEVEVSDNGDEYVITWPSGHWLIAQQDGKVYIGKSPQDHSVPIRSTALFGLTVPIDAEALPCPFCNLRASIEACTLEPCNCGKGWVGCINDECPVQPIVDEPADNPTERLRIWNDRKFPLHILSPQQEVVNSWPSEKMAQSLVLANAISRSGVPDSVDWNIIKRAAEAALKVLLAPPESADE